MRTVACLIADPERSVLSEALLAAAAVLFVPLGVLVLGGKKDAATAKSNKTTETEASVADDESVSVDDELSVRDAEDTEVAETVDFDSEQVAAYAESLDEVDADAVIEDADTELAEDEVEMFFDDDEDTSKKKPKRK